jgi:hypothetical protein
MSRGRVRQIQIELNQSEICIYFWILSVTLGTSLPPARGRAGERGNRPNDARVSNDPPHPTLPLAGGREKLASRAKHSEVTGEGRPFFTLPVLRSPALERDFAGPMVEVLDIIPQPALS